MPCWGGRGGYRGTSLIRNTPLLGPHNRTIQGSMVVLGGGGVFYERGTPVPSEAGSIVWVRWICGRGLLGDSAPPGQ